MIDTIIQGDSKDILKEIESDSVDLIVTDPPYGYSFMGKDWDKAVIGVDIWRECFRVLKAGAFAFIMSAPRQDVLSRMIVNLEDAGFVVGFTSIYFTYASGFPKAGNISKLIDKRMGAEREVVGFSQYHCEGRKPYNQSQNIKFVTSEKDLQDDGKYLTIPSTPEAKALDGSYGGFQPKPAVEVVLVVMKPLSEKTFVDQALANGHGVTWLDDGRIPFENDKDKIDGQSSRISLADKGTNQCDMGSLDRSNRTDIQGRFPANLLVEQNVLDSRGYNQKESNPNYRGGKDVNCVVCGKTFWLKPSLLKRGRKTCSIKCKYIYHSQWMKNEQNPKWTGGHSAEYKKDKTSKAWKERRLSVYKRDNFTCQLCGVMNGKLDAHHLIPWRLTQDDSMENLITLCPKCHKTVEAYWSKINLDTQWIGEIGVETIGESFSRYFSLDAWWDNRIKKLPESVQKTFPFLIVPKASKSEKNKGCEGLEEKQTIGGGGIGIDNTDLEKVSHAYGSIKASHHNHHPTVKPLKLFFYLTILGSREGDLILDPFVGSGTSCVSAKILNRHWIGIERESEYVTIAEKRLQAEKQQLEFSLAGG
jgi:DNA modification methylase/5-methylcytosine-specific restriction endonuclease McrA